MEPESVALETRFVVGPAGALLHRAGGAGQPGYAPTAVRQRVAVRPTTDRRSQSTMPVPESKDREMERHRIFKRVHLATLAVAGAVLVAGAALGVSASTSTSADAAALLGQAPPEWAANAGAWPAHNYDLANTRATTQSPINSQTVSQLKVKWTFALKGASAFGIFASTPISLNGTVYLQDLNSNVYALDRSTGKLEWKHAFNKPSIGPNGVAY